MVGNMVRRSRALRSATTAVLAAAAVALGTAAAAQELVVTYDQSQLLKLDRPAREIVIGNPTIADVLVHGGNMLIVTGKTFGITNIIALDAERNIILERRIVVQRDEASVVNLHKGGRRQSFNCTPQCNPMITVGDDTAYFESVAKSSQAKISFSRGASEDGGEKQ